MYWDMVKPPLASKSSVALMKIYVKTFNGTVVWKLLHR